MKLHGGTIQASSVEGKGSCFRVSLPTGSAHLPSERIGVPRITSTVIGAASYLEEAERSLPAESAEVSVLSSKLEENSLTQNSKFKTQRSARQFAQRGENTHTTGFGGGTEKRCVEQAQNSHILLVDDNADMRDYLKRLLGAYWQVETAENGAIALAMIQEYPPDLVLSDVMMPKMDGFQLLHALRSNPNTNGIPIILLSARAGEEATIEGLEAGADDYLIKPFSARELIARINTQLQMVRLRQEQSANRFKNEFLMTVTHELQAPLVAILGWSRLLQTKSFNPATTAMALRSIERNAKIEAKLVKDLLDVSSILSEKLRLKFQLIDLVPLVQKIVTTQRKTAEAKSIQLVETILNTTQVTVLADPDRLEQIIVNLLDNAIKFTSSGGQVSIQLEHFGSDAQITITDTGIGISPDFLPYVFDRFSQAEVPSRHSPGGVGIGGAIARHLVELHGGTIEVASDGQGRGATFTVLLPLVASAELNNNAPVEQ